MFYSYPEGFYIGEGTEIVEGMQNFLIWLGMCLQVIQWYSHRWISAQVSAVFDSCFEGFYSEVGTKIVEGM